MKQVFLSSPTNSQMFTRCCNVAICDDQALCPRCREEVYPGMECSDHERSKLRWSQAYGPIKRKQGHYGN